MKVFVTGGNGFIGSRVVRQLRESGRDVRCLLRDASNTDRLDGLTFEGVAGDVRDRGSVRAGMSGCDATIHLAAPGGWDADDADLLRGVIEDGTQHVLDAASELGGHRVVFVSSTAAIDGSENPRVFDERAPFTIRDTSLHYAHAKHRAELLARNAVQAGVPVVVVNPAEVYGPGDTAFVTAGNLIDFIESALVLVCRGGTSVVHVDDVATGVIAALDRGHPGERYILGGDNLTIRQLAELCLRIIGRRAPIVTVPNSAVRLAARAAIRFRIPVPFNPSVVPYATRYWFVDNAKARRELGVRFRGAQETIGETITWLEQAGRVKVRRPTV